MGYNFLTNISGCIESATQMMGGNLSLIPYSHAPVIVVSLLLGFFVLVNNRKLKSAKILFFLSLLFSLWVTFSMISWISSNSVSIMFFWSLFGMVDSLIFLTSFYLVFSFLNKNDLRFLYKVLLLILVLPIILLTPTTYNLISFNFNGCYANDNLFFNYIFVVKAILALLLLITAIYRYFTTEDRQEKRQILLMSLGISFFLLAFFLFGYLADTYEKYILEIWGVFSMTIFMAIIAVLIVKFKAFDIKLLGAQALVWSSIILIGSELFFVESNVNKILVTITLVISSILGLILVRSVKKEVALREELERANTNQESLIHFISHQLKGFFTKSKMIFAGIIEDDFEKSSDVLKDVAKEGLLSDNNAVSMIQDILGASNYKKGTIAYNLKDVDLAEIVRAVCSGFIKEIKEKGLELKLNISNKPVMVLADVIQITQVIKNLVDNSIKYTPSGSLTVSLNNKNIEGENRVVFEIEDTGVGLSESDKNKLFTEGGKGEESMKMNVNSTGYGLYIVKKIVENHGGKIWAESDGRGKGSRFFVVLPMK